MLRDKDESGGRETVQRCSAPHAKQEATALTDAKEQEGEEASGPRGVEAEKVSGTGFSSGENPQSFDDTQPANNFWGTVIPPGFLLAGRYRIDHFIARGGMGEVYAAYDCVLADRIALKTVTATSSSDVEALDALRAEVTLSRKISHPNVCRMHDIGVHVSLGAPQLTFLTMEYVDGESLGARLVREGSIPEQEAARLLSGILAGLQAAHEANVLHRDLKSDNVMLRSRPNGEPTPLIMDFGLASALSPTSSRVSSDQAMVGSLAYMAPEQVQGDALRVVTDIYSVGVIFFEMLTGQLPFKASSPALAALKRLHEPAPRVRSVDPRIPAELDRIVARALQHRPQDRYPSARAMHRDLLDYLGVSEEARVSLIGASSPSGSAFHSGPTSPASVSLESMADDTTLVSGKPSRPLRVSTVEVAPSSEDESLPVLAATAAPRRSRRARLVRNVAALGALGGLLVAWSLWLRNGERVPAAESIPVTIGGGNPSPVSLQYPSSPRPVNMPLLPQPTEAVATLQQQAVSPGVTAPSAFASPSGVVASPPATASSIATASPTAPSVANAPLTARNLPRKRPDAPTTTSAAMGVTHTVEPAPPEKAQGSPDLVYPPGLKRPSLLRPTDTAGVQ